ncbi:enoyl-CoA delta isomerase 2-like [Tigriopus californicus]|uniref:enoyl-CoA delta isomerase 2-like n=1 Tax=Tigriopus californicus TaxID=6832 RepID=UPI0027DA9F2D|nr:enoyl-CoA delta isomerase 2-like [Tigriopus californicus]
MKSIEFVSSHNGAVVTIRLNVPQKRNAISLQMFRELIDFLRASESDPKLTIVVLTGTGTYFSSGNDLTNFTNAFQDPGANLDQVIKHGAQLVSDMVEAVAKSSKILVAKVNGHATGIMVTLLGLFDLVYAVDTAQFLTPFVQLGQSPEGASSYTFPRMFGRGVAFETFALQRSIRADFACKSGLVTGIFPQGALNREVNKKVDHLATLPRESLLATKRLISQSFLEKVLQANEREIRELEERFKSDECLEAIMAFFTKKSKL